MNYSNNSDVTVKSLSKKYGATGKITALSEINLEIQAGEFVSILGPNASGKTTLLKIIAGVLGPSGGSVSIQHAIAYMPQEHALLPWMTVEENLLLPSDLRGIPRVKSRKRVEELLNEFGFAIYASQYPATLSGGTRQKVALLRTLREEHPILLLDEPFAPLDALSRLAAQDWLLKLLEKRRSTTILVTHDIREAIFLSDRIFVFQNGKMRDTISVPFERPRTRDQLMSPQAMELEKKLFSLLI